MTASIRASSPIQTVGPALASRRSARERPSASTLARFSAPKLGEVNNRLMRTALKQVTKKFRRAWLGKIMPLGIGAILGTVANRKLAKNVITNSRESLGPVPASFTAGA